MSFIQHDLFGQSAPYARRPRRTEIDLEALDRFAILYTATEAGNNSGIRFAMSCEDARTWCAHEFSRGCLHGTEWAYFWTSLRNFIFRDAEYSDDECSIEVNRKMDNGSWDARILAAGCTKIDVSDFRHVFGPLGVKIVETGEW